MKLKLFIFLIILVTLTACNLEDAFYKTSLTNDENPFLSNVYTIETAATTSETEFAIITDVHLGRELKYDGIKRYDDNFEAFLSNHVQSKGAFTALLSLGDLVDEQEPVNATVNSFIQRFSKYCSNRFIEMIGNHDSHVVSSQEWENSNPNLPGITYYAKRMCTIKCGEISIYITNNSRRLFGAQQLQYLEEALKQDTNKIKIVLAHEVVMSGGAADQTLILFGDPDIYERSNFARIMEENNVALVLSGHTHKGAVTYKYKEKTYEMNLCAYHAREMALDLESKGNWYTLSFDTENRKIVIKEYLAATKEQICEESFAY